MCGRAAANNVRSKPRLLKLFRAVIGVFRVLAILYFPEKCWLFSFEHPTLSLVGSASYQIGLPHPSPSQSFN
jgi:hypothetical protein